MQKHTIARSGAPPVDFVGIVVTEGRSFTAEELDRGYIITIYRTDDNKYVAHVSYHSKWKSEAPGDIVVIADDAHDLALKLLDCDPTKFVIGHPPGKQFEERQKRLLESLRLQYRSLAGRVLAAVPGASDKV